MTPEDWLSMQDDLLAVRDMNAVSIAVRRGGSTLAAQTVRVARTGLRAGVTNSAGAQQPATGVVVLGETTLNIQQGDRFTLGGVLYEVTFVRPNRRAATMAEAQAVQ